jgi:hypothetical protein
LTFKAENQVCLIFRAIVSTDYARTVLLLLGRKTETIAQRIFSLSSVVRTTLPPYFCEFANSIIDTMINPAGTTPDTDQQGSPFPNPSSTSPNYSDNGNTLADRIRPTEDENRDPHRDEDRIDGLPTNYSERPSGTIAQRQMRRFAKSADKRQSVHMLGSIEHLKHHFVSPAIADDLVLRITLLTI